MMKVGFGILHVPSRVANARGASLPCIPRYLTRTLA